MPPAGSPGSPRTLRQMKNWRDPPKTPSEITKSIMNDAKREVKRSFANAEMQKRSAALEEARRARDPAQAKMRELKPLERYKLWRAEVTPKHRMPPQPDDRTHSAWRGPHQIGLMPKPRLLSSTSMPVIMMQPPMVFRSRDSSPPTSARRAGTTAQLVDGAAATRKQQQPTPPPPSVLTRQLTAPAKAIHDSVQRPFSAQQLRVSPPMSPISSASGSVRRRPRTALTRSSTRKLPPSEAPVFLDEGPSEKELQLQRETRDAAAVTIQNLLFRPWHARRMRKTRQKLADTKAAADRRAFMGSQQGSAWAEGGDADYEELEAEAMAYGLSDEQCEAAEKYDARHVRYGGEVRKDMVSLKARHPRRPAELSARYNQDLLHVFRNRYFLYEKVEFDEGPGQKRLKKKPRFDLMNSVWAPRKLTGNTKDFFERNESLAAMFDVDWKGALESHQLAQKIVRTYTPAEQWRQLPPADEAPGSAEVEKVTKVLKPYARLIYGSFDHYAIASSSKKQRDVFNVRFNAFVQFCNDLELPDEDCPGGRLETCFAIVDAKVSSDHMSALDRHNASKALNRSEWIQVLVRIAIAKFLPMDERGNSIGAVAAAVVQLFELHFKRYLHIDALQNSDKFRAAQCYTARMDLVLRKHHSSMRALYNRYARLVGDDDGRFGLQHKKLLSIDEWLLFTTHLFLTSEKQLQLHVTVKEVKQIFLWSRMRACPDHSDHSEIKLRHLTFEDFMEALVRLAAIMAFPTDQEVEETGAADAGEFLLVLEAEQPETFLEFLDGRKAHWSEEPKQGTWRCVDHLLTYIVRVVEMNLTGDEDDINDGIITAEEAEMFVGGRLKERELVRRRSSMFDSEAITEKLAKVQEQVRSACRSVKAFEPLSDGQITVLAKAMRSAMWNRAEYVFEQGDEGDAFYVITSGEALVLRDDTDQAELHHLREKDDQVRVLATLGEGSCFGERALLRSEARFASILVASKELHVKMMTREQFELLFAGSDMHALMKDSYA